jgi:hypothetical protein
MSGHPSRGAESDRADVDLIVDLADDRLRGLLRGPLDAIEVACRV